MSRVDKLVERMAGSPTFARIAPSIVPKIDGFLGRLTGGKVTLTGLYSPALMLTTTGRKSGEPRTVPLACFPRDDDLIVVGSNFGREHHPAWSLNLLANPSATVVYRGRRFPVTARVAEGEERTALWSRITEKMPHFDRYGERAGRDIRVFVLERA